MQAGERQATPSSRCPDAQALLPAYVEGELGAHDVRRLRGHLEICAACRSEEAAFRATLGTLHGRPLAAHGNLYAGFEAKLQQAEARAARRLVRFRWGAAFGSVVAVAGASAAVAPHLLRSAAPPPTTPVVVVRHAHQAVSKEVASHKTTTPEKVAATSFDPFASQPMNKAPAESTGSSDAGSATPTDTVAQPIRRTRRHSAGTSAEPQPPATADFYDVKPQEGLDARQQMVILPHQQNEVTVAAVQQPPAHEGREAGERDRQEPQSEAKRDPQGQGGAMQTSETQTAQPSSSAAEKPVTVVPVSRGTVEVGGRVTKVDTSVGLDRRGKPVQVNVNIQSAAALLMRHSGPPQGFFFPRGRR